MAHQLPKWISKTKWMRGFQCPKSLYLTLYQKELEPPVTPQLQALFDQGNAVTEQARSFYGQGQLIQAPPWDFIASLRLTREALAQAKPLIFEAAFEYQGCYARVDILKYNPSSERWSLIEVKSSTKVKDEHLMDISLQAWIVAKSGLPLESIEVMHLNPEYIHEETSPPLFINVDVTPHAREFYFKITEQVTQLKKSLSYPEAPNIKIGPQCDTPNPCPFKPHCFDQAHLPTPNVFDLPKKGLEAWDLFSKDLVSFESLKDQALPELQTRMVQSHLKNETYINTQAIRSAAQSWGYPRAFLDFETINPAIPVFKGTRPYQQVPFQVSVHLQKSPSSPLEHFEYLHQENSDPRLPIVQILLDSCLNAETIFAYYSRFELDRIKELADYFPKHKKELLSITEKFYDPLPLIRENYYDPKFNFSFSLKAVSPALLPHLPQYQDMAVGDGLAAQRAYMQLAHAPLKPKEKSELVEACLEYCKQDTLALVQLVDFLEHL